MISPAVFPWGDSHFLQERFRKVKRVVESELEGDFLYFHLGKLQVRTGSLDTQLVVIFHRRIRRFLHEQRKQMRAGIADKIRDAADGNLFFQIILHKENAFLDDVLHFDVLDFPVLWQVFDGSEEITQAKTDVLEIVRTVSHFKIPKHALEQHEPVLIAAGSGIFEGDYLSDDGMKKMRVFAFEVNPVNTPGVAQVGTVRMWPVLGDDKDLMTGQAVSFVLTFNPSLPFFAVDKDVLGGSFSSFAVMIFRMRIVPDMRHIQLPRDFVACL